ncbi:MAG: hypothetical protein M1135_01700 [Candidatus Omnitrophica bacterium]|nr:hypothetical protein [Candidatus Omnitrophota bacterium]
MKKNGRLLPNWIPNTIIISFFLLIHVFFSSKNIALGYRLSNISNKYETLEGLNQYYNVEFLKETSEENIMEKLNKMHLALETPKDWKIKTIEINREHKNKSDGKAEAATR